MRKVKEVSFRGKMAFGGLQNNCDNAGELVMQDEVNMLQLIGI